MLRVIFAGTPTLSSTILQSIIGAKQYNIIACLTQPDKPAGRGRKLLASPVKQLALANNIPVYQPVTLKYSDATALLATLAADVLVIVAYGLMIPPAILALPKYGCINVHMSLLPRWRGAAPIQRAILAGDSETGVTIMQMDAHLDTGDILSAAIFPITSNDTSDTLQTKMASVGANELIAVLAGLQTGTIQPRHQDHAQATYAHKIAKPDAQINWQHTTAQIDRQIRAFNPVPIAFTQSNTTTIRVWQATMPTNQDKGKAMPGTIITANKHGIEVATINGIISLQTIQLPGKRPLSVAEVLNAKQDLFVPGVVLE